MVTRFTKSGSSAPFAQAAGGPSRALPLHGGLDLGTVPARQSVTQYLPAAVQTAGNGRHASADASRFLASLAGRVWNFDGDRPRLAGFDPACWGEGTDGGSPDRSDIHWTGGVVSNSPRSPAGADSLDFDGGTSDDDGFGRAASVYSAVFASLKVTPSTPSATLTGRIP